MNTIKKILIVDDDPSAAGNIEFLLEKNSFQVSMVGSADECHHYLEQGRPDLILMDVILPDIPGTELCKALKSKDRYNDIPVILISGLRVSPEERQLGISCGASDYLTRPVKNEELLASIRKSLILSYDEEARNISDRESAAFIRLGLQDTDESAIIFSSASLKEQYPESFENAIREYAAIIDGAIEERFFRVTPTMHDKISHLAENLGFLKAGARDIIELHRICLAGKIVNQYTKEARVISEEARYILVELMGNMINYYRNKSF